MRRALIERPIFLCRLAYGSRESRHRFKKRFQFRAGVCLALERSVLGLIALIGICERPEEPIESPCSERGS